MKKLFENSCAKGCLVYVAALFILIVLTSMGIGGMRERFDAEAQDNRPGASAYTMSRQEAPAASLPAPVGDANPAEVVPTATPQPPAVIVLPTLPVVILPPQAQAQTAAPAPAPQPGQAQVQGQGQSGVSGEASSPFYIVQEGDTLWSISQQAGVAVDALRSANSIADSFIQSGQLLYLPQGQPQQAQPPSAPQQPAVPDTGVGGQGEMPNMPGTGIKKNP